MKNTKTLTPITKQQFSYGSRALLFSLIFWPCFAFAQNQQPYTTKTPLSFLGFKLYDIELERQEKTFSYNQKLAIKIKYNRSFSKKELVETSIDEICRINSIKRSDIEKLYQSRFEQLFVDVKKGDEKIAVFDPNFGLELYYNGKLTEKINDPIFAKRFIDIWLSDKARFTKVRNILIGEK